MMNSMIQTQKRTDNMPLSVLNYRLIGRMVTMLIIAVPPWPVSPKSQEKAEKQENKSLTSPVLFLLYSVNVWTLKHH